MGTKQNFNVVQADFVNKTRRAIRRIWIESGEQFRALDGTFLALSWSNEEAIPDICSIDDAGIKYDFAVEMNRNAVFGAKGIYFRRVAVAWNGDQTAKRILLEFSFAIDPKYGMPARY